MMTTDKTLLLVTNFANGYADEDLSLAECLSNNFAVQLVNPCGAVEIAQDGGHHKCLIRNAWPNGEFDSEFNSLRQLVKTGCLVTYNPPGRQGREFAEDKTYLTQLYAAGYPVIPTWLSATDMLASGFASDCIALKKPLGGCSSIGIAEAPLKEIGNTEGYIVQPKLCFKNEVSFFFIDNRFSYAVASSGPGNEHRWDLREFTPTPEELKWAETFVAWNSIPYGIQRIDAGRTKHGTLLLMEIEDFMPYLSLFECSVATGNRMVSKATCDRVVEELVSSLKANLWR